MKSNGRSTPHSLSEAIQQLERTAHAKLGKEFDEIKQAIDDLKPHIHAVRDQALKSAQESLDKGKEYVEDFGNNVDKQVHKHPWAAIGIAAFVALLLGMLLGRGRRD